MLEFTAIAAASGLACLVFIIRSYERQISELKQENLALWRKYQAK